jgi:adenylate cyclase
VAAADRLIRFRPDKHFSHRWRAAALAQLGRLDEAKQSLRTALDASPEQFRTYVSQRPPWFRPADHALMVEGLRKAGWTEG